MSNRSDEGRLRYSGRQRRVLGPTGFPSAIARAGISCYAILINHPYDNGLAKLYHSPRTVARIRMPVRKNSWRPRARIGRR
jgi:hypothetical protein